MKGEKAKETRQRVSTTFVLLTTMFSVCLIISNLMEIKVVDLGFMTITAGLVTFPISYIINDCVVEIYGLRNARFVIFTGFAMNLIATLLLQVGLWLPGSAEWGGQASMELIFGAVPRMLFASFTAFLCGSLVNAQVMAWLKEGSHGRRGFSFRAIVSTIFGEGCDSLIFFPLAFWGSLPWEVILSLIATQTVLKTLYEIIVLPLTMVTVKALRKHEAES